MPQSRSISEVVIANLVSRSFDLGNHFGVAQGSFADEEESCLGVVPMKNLSRTSSVKVGWGPSSKESATTDDESELDK